MLETLLQPTFIIKRTNGRWIKKEGEVTFLVAHWSQSFLHDPFNFPELSRDRDNVLVSGARNSRDYINMGHALQKLNNILYKTRIMCQF